MGIKKVEHIGIAVRDIASADALFERLLGAPAYKHESVESEQVTTSFYQSGDTKIELLEATDPASAISKFIEKRGEGMHHIAFEVDDIHAERARLEEEGFEFTAGISEGADNKLVCFVHPKTANGVLVELCQERS